MATKNKKPTHTLRCGNIKATIWENPSEKEPFFATTFSRPFKDQSGEWRNGTSFGLNDLEALLTVAREAKDLPAPQAGGVDGGSCPEALSSLPGKPPALRGLPFHFSWFSLPLMLGYIADTDRSIQTSGSTVASQDRTCQSLTRFNS